MRGAARAGLRLLLADMACPLRGQRLGGADGIRDKEFWGVKAKGGLSLSASLSSASPSRDARSLSRLRQHSCLSSRVFPRSVLEPRPCDRSRTSTGRAGGFVEAREGSSVVRSLFSLPLSPSFVPVTRVRRSRLFSWLRPVSRRFSLTVAVTRVTSRVIGWKPTFPSSPCRSGFTGEYESTHLVAGAVGAEGEAMIGACPRPVPYHHHPMWGGWASGGGRIPCYFRDGLVFRKFREESRGEIPGATLVDGGRLRASGSIEVIIVFDII